MNYYRTTVAAARAGAEQTAHCTKLKQSLDASMGMQKFVLRVHV